MARPKSVHVSFHPAITKLWMENLLNKRFIQTHKALKSLDNGIYPNYSVVGVLIECLMEKPLLSELKWHALGPNDPMWGLVRSLHYPISHGLFDPYFVPHHIVEKITRFRNPEVMPNQTSANKQFLDRLCEREYESKKFTYKKAARYIEKNID